MCCVVLLQEHVDAISVCDVGGGGRDPGGWDYPTCNDDATTTRGRADDDAATWWARAADAARCHVSVGRTTLGLYLGEESATNKSTFSTSTMRISYEGVP